ncbi:hypothetical protein [Hydrocarboniphaga sp.]|uniref:hypothetical protein n=1 Tax=Hydrocarboniphaga sp. TaxID=2033016 RepID=UPI003D0B5E34
MLTTVATVTLRILLFRAGPQDLPYAPTLTRLLIPLALLANFALAAVSLPPPLAALSSAMGVLGLALSSRTLLRLRKMENRYLQTFHALLLTGAVASLATIAPLSEVMPDMIKLFQHPELLEQKPESLDLPSGTMFLLGMLMLWNFVVSAHIYRQAAELSSFASIAVAMLISVALQLFVSATTSVFGSLLGLLPLAGSSGVPAVGG